MMRLPKKASTILTVIKLWCTGRCTTDGVAVLLVGGMGWAVVFIIEGLAWNQEDDQHWERTGNHANEATSKSHLNI